MALFLTAFIAVSSVLLQAAGDLPVHCLRHQVAGDWDFYLGPSGPKRSSCGHRRPDNEEKQPSVALSDVTSTKQVSLRAPNVASTTTDDNGRWTMIYDEAFEVRVDGLALLAFSRYDLSYKDGIRSNTSRCGETQLGWYHDQDRTAFGCFYARKRAPADEHASLLSFVPSPVAKTTSYDQPLDHSYHSSFADSLNMLQDLWTAKPHSRFAGMSLRDMNSMAGLIRSLPLSLQRDLFGMTPQDAVPDRPSRPTSFLQVEQKHRRSSAHESTTLSEGIELPTSWDWRNVSGANWLDHVMDQGSCGSCYVVATTRMLSARHRIRQQQPKHEAFSISFPLMCSEYTQGCNGGYAFLASKWSHDVGLVPESCAGYDGESGGQCGIQCDVRLFEKRWRADNYHYVGGYYGAASEPEIMHELVTKGPLVASFEPKNDLMYYSGGIYKSVPNQRSEWEKVDHAVLLIGYGEDARGQKYWLLQNSWGDSWGEDGFFRMARGSDESGIESIVVSADVVEDTRPAVLAQFTDALF
jgi:cathepsin C